MVLRRKAFTLVEVLVASTIGVFIALVAVGALRTITVSSEMLDRNITTAAEVRFAANMIARDLTNIYRDEESDNYRFIGTIQEVSEDLSSSYLIFYTVGRSKARVGQPEGDVYEVEYSLVADEERSVLMRRLWPNPNKLVEEPGGVLTVIAENIETFYVQYYNGEEWADEWPEEMQSLPELLEITLIARQTGHGKPLSQSMLVPLTRSGGDMTTLETGGQTASGDTSAL
ncbi:MAG: prepilin-type N-terminal cleavage/methylation domain-containing protein [Sedimentisphaerales bacterium]|nr:prepilin-type N-terminal cleavage/methylation domain-containing protein [Sedimentisphaerales bacterium]